MQTTVHTMMPSSSSGAAAMNLCGSGSATNVAFVTLLTGAKYAAPAACLPRQLRQVGSTCPIILVYDDDDASLPLPMLHEAFNASSGDRMMPLSTLKARYANAFNNHGLSGPAASPSDVIVGRRLYTSVEKSNLLLKLWLWALPMQRAVFLDIDVVLVRNVDSLLAAQGTLAAVFCEQQLSGIFYNTGVMVFTPSLSKLHELLEVARHIASPWRGFYPWPGERYAEICSPRNEPHAYRRLFPNTSNPFGACRKVHAGRQPLFIQKACESKHTDQSAINHIFGASPSSLPSLPILASPSSGLNAAGGGVRRLLPIFNDNPWTGLNNETHIFHFSGEPKPWAAAALSSLARRMRGLADSRFKAVALWRRRCWVQHGT